LIHDAHVLPRCDHGSQIIMRQPNRVSGTARFVQSSKKKKKTKRGKLKGKISLCSRNWNAGS